MTSMIQIAKVRCILSKKSWLRQPDIHRNFCRSAFFCVNKDLEPVHGVHYETSLHKEKDKKYGESGKSVPESADVVVIGGGSVGCSTAYHLAKLNIGKVVLIEKERLTAGTTWHTAGILWNLRDGRALTRMQMHTKELLSKILPEETGFNSGWIETGSIFVTRRQKQLDAQKKKSLMGTEYGVESRVVDVAEISELHPLMNTVGLVGGLYSPQDGSLDPATLCTSYIKAAAKYGAQVFEGCEVTDIKTDEDFLGLEQVVAVETNRGTVKTNNVVNCTGAWAPYIAKMVGLTVPQLTYKHAYVVTQGIPGIEKVPHLRDIEAGIYNKRQGDALLFGGYEKNPTLVGLVEKDMAFGLYDMDWDTFEAHMNSAIALVPAVAEVGIRSTVCGPESFTSDGNPLMGESPNVRGFFYGSAFNSGGMMLGGGAGQQLAHWVAHGSPEYDMSSCDINRFSTSVTKHRSWLVETCHEYFITKYDMHHVNKQPLAGRNLRKTPLHEIHLSNGAFFSSVHGWEVPAYFDYGKRFPLLNYDYFGIYDNTKHEVYEYRDRLDRDCTFEMEEQIHNQIKKEFIATTESAGVFDVSHLSKFSLSGKLADQVVQTLFTSDATKLQQQERMQSLMLNKGGTIVSEVMVAKKEEQNYWITAPSQLQQFILRHLNQFLQDSKLQCQCDDITDQYAILHLRGPQSPSLLLDAGFGNMESGRGCEGSIGDKKVSIIRSFTQSPGYDIYCKMEDVSVVYTALMESDPKCLAAGIRALEALDMEAGEANLLNTNLVGSTPYEAGMMNLCELRGGREYVGKSSLLQALKQPLTAKLVCLTAQSSAPIFSGDVIWRDGIYAGVIGQAAYGYNSGKYILKGFLKPQRGKSLTEEFVASGNYTVGRGAFKFDAKLWD